MSYKISTHTTETYKVRWTGEGYGYWADITIDPSETGGRIQIASDWGDWQNYWGATGNEDNSFKRFLCQIDIGYAAGKFGADNYFSSDATIGMWERQYAESPFDDKKKDEEIKEEIHNLRHDSPNDLNSFITHVYHTCPLVIEHFEHPDTVVGIAPKFKRFWETVWPVFIEQLKTELSKH